MNIQACSADQSPIDVFHGDEFSYVLGLYTAAVKDADPLSRLGGKDFYQKPADEGLDFLGLLGSGGLPRADGPDRLVSDDPGFRVF